MEYSERIIRYHSPSKISIVGADQVDLYLENGYYAYDYDTDYSNGTTNVSVNLNFGSPWYSWGWYDPWFYNPWGYYSSWWYRPYYWGWGGWYAGYYSPWYDHGGVLHGAGVTMVIMVAFIRIIIIMLMLLLIIITGMTMAVLLTDGMVVPVDMQQQ